MWLINVAGTSLGHDTHLLECFSALCNALSPSHGLLFVNSESSSGNCDLREPLDGLQLITDAQHRFVCQGHRLHQSKPNLRCCTYQTRQTASTMTASTGS